MERYIYRGYFGILRTKSDVMGAVYHMYDMWSGATYGPFRNEAAAEAFADKYIARTREKSGERYQRPGYADRIECNSSWKPISGAILP